MSEPKPPIEDALDDPALQSADTDLPPMAEGNDEEDEE